MPSILNRLRVRALPAALLSGLLLAGCGDVQPMAPTALNTPLHSMASILSGSPGLVISQVYGGGGNSGAPYTHDFIELFNRGTASVSLAGLSIQYASATGTGNFGANSGQLTELPNVTLAPGQYYLVQQAAGAGNGVALPTPDLVDPTPIAMAAGAGKVALVTGTTSLGCNGSAGQPCSAEQLARILDLVGYGSANFFEGGGAAPTLTNTTAALRGESGCTDTDSNAADFASGAPAPRNMATALSPCASPPAVAGTTPASDAADVPLGTNIEITFSKLVTVSGAWFTIDCSVSGTRTATVSGGPTTFTLDPQGDLAGDETCTVTVLASGVTDQAEPPVRMAADYSWSFGTAGINACELPYTATYTIQGSGMATPLSGQIVTTQGVVIGDYEGPQPALRGFYIQDPTGDGDPATSDGLFVFNGTSDNVNLGDVVRVTGTAAEFQDQTQITGNSIVTCGTGASVTPVDIALPFPSVTYLERYEGMLVRLQQTLTVTEHFQLGRFGQVVLSSGGRLLQPTQVAMPGGAALATQAQNDRNRIIIDDDLNSQNPDPILFGRGGNPLSASNTLRGGDQATGIVGVMTYTWGGAAASGNAYRVRPVRALGGGVPGFVAANPRPLTPPAVGGSLKVAGFNLLNYFNTFSGCTGGVGGAGMDCRGADNAAEFNRQWPKTVAAILGMDVDVLGVVEMENDGYGPSSAIADLVDRLNAATAPGTYAYIDVDAATGQVNAMGTDAIRNALIYKPARVTPVGSTAALNTVAFVNGGDTGPRNRPSLAQAFEQPGGARFIVNVNHLKSKGSACNAPDAGDGQGNCNAVRLNAVNRLLEWLATDPTGTTEMDVLIVGDLNAYAMEDPIRALLAGGFTNLAGVNAYSYAFDGQWGTLDYALASASLASQVASAAKWHINADEPNVLDYNTNFKSPGQITSLYAPDQFRVSDHDPAIVGASLLAPYAFGGFLPPIAPLPTMNIAKAGQTIPVKFSLGGYKGMDIFAAGHPRSVSATCDLTAGTGQIEETVTAGQSSLSYDTATDTYTYLWKSERGWAATCRDLVVRFDDAGSAYRARFHFTR
jgi:uncharacterized protein